MATLRGVAPGCGLCAHPALRRLPTRRAIALRRCVASVQSSLAGGSSEDPYKVLGLKSGASYDSIQRAYKKYVAEAKRAGDEAAQQRIEAAHSTLMMSALTSRLQGKASVDKDILYADRARYFPWRPRLYLAERRVILYAAIAQAVLLAWALLSPLTAGTQPVVWSAIAGAVGNVYKQNRINPPPARGLEMSDAERKQGGKNILRGCFLAVLATFGGCVLFYTAPDALAAQLNRVLPFWFYEGQSMLLAIGSCSLNLLFTAVMR